MATPWGDKLKLKTVYGISVQLLFYVIGCVEAPVFLIVEKFLPKHKRDGMWRNVSMMNSALLKKLAGIEFVIEDHTKKFDGPFIYVSNHGSVLDGFFCFGLLGPNVDCLVGPRGMFRYPFNVFCFKAGAIDVLRDSYDEKHFKKANTKKVAIKKMINSLKQGRNVLIFGEGHVEHSHKFHYLHTGAARVALRAKRPIVPMTFIGEEKVVDRVRMCPGKIKVIFGKPMSPPKITKAYPFRKAVVDFTKDVRDQMMKQLPHRYHRDFLSEKKRKDVGVFFDIDHTIYKGYCMHDFFHWLQKEGFLSRLSIWRVYFALILYNLKIISMEDLSAQSAKCVAGWSKEKLDILAHEFFKIVETDKFDHDLLAYIKDHQKAGHHIVSLSQVIEPLAKHFKELIGAKGFIATKLEIKNGVYTGKIKRLVYNSEKSKQAKLYAKKHGLKLKDSYAYADAYSDLPIFKVVGHPIVVKPHSRDLLSIAKKKHWEIVH